MFITKLFLITTILSIIPSQIIRLEILGEGAITLSDVLATITFVSFSLESFIERKKLVFEKSIVYAWTLFVLAAAISNIFSVNFQSLKDIAIGTTFLIRFIIYTSLYLVAANVFQNKQENLYKLILLAGFIFTLIGIVQFFTFPDLSKYTSYGWDPHINRLFATTLDPNFSGLMICFFFAISSTLYIKTKKNIYLGLTALFVIAILMTLSRSSYLALTTTVLVLGLTKSKKFFLIALAVLIASAVLITPVRQRIVGAISIDETSQARIESWQEALIVFQKNPVFGVGFNNYRLVKQQYGIIDYDQTGGHSGSGSDSSLLLVAATTGTYGLVFFVWLLTMVLMSLLKGVKRNVLYLAPLSSFAALIIHSQFVNSFFYPQVMLIFWIVFSIAIKTKVND